MTTKEERLLQASRELVKAILAGDLAAAARHLSARGQAIAEGTTPTAETVALGEHAAALLGDLKRRAGAEAALLSHLRSHLASDARPRLDVRI